MDLIPPIHPGVELPSPLREQIQQHARNGYPEEVCGILVGRGHSVVHCFPIPNAAEPHQRRARYALDPRDILRADRKAQALGLDIIGCYHSHPDHPAVPSATDRSLAWEILLYLIVPVTAAGPGEPRLWQLGGDGTFTEIPLLG
jgi:proteasome lid subunit RPN8/RPN11